MIEVQFKAAMAAGDYNTVEVVVGMMNDVDNYLSDGRTLLYTSVKAGDLYVTRMLIEKFKANPELKMKESGSTVIHAAAYHLRLEVLEYLLSYPGINCNIKNSYGETPLTNALQSCNSSDLHDDRIKVVVLILSKSSFNSLTSSLSRVKLTVEETTTSPMKSLENNLFIDLILSSQNTSLLSHILETAAIRGLSDDAVKRILSNYYIEIDTPFSYSGKTLLYLASSFGATSVVKTLLQLGAGVNIQVWDTITCTFSNVVKKKKKKKKKKTRFPIQKKQPTMLLFRILK